MRIKNGREKHFFSILKGTRIEGGKMVFFVDKTRVFFYLFLPLQPQKKVSSLTPGQALLGRPEKRRWAQSREACQRKILHLNLPRTTTGLLR